MYRELPRASPRWTVSVIATLMLIALKAFSWMRPHEVARDRGHVIVATFGPDGPLQCSGLDVLRYDADTLHAEFGTRFVF